MTPPTIEATNRMMAARSHALSRGRTSAIDNRGPTNHTRIPNATTPSVEAMMRIQMALVMEARVRFGSIGPRDQDFDPPILGPSLWSRVGGDRNVRALTLHLDAILFRNARSQERRDGFCALHGEVEVGGKAHSLDRRRVGVADDLDIPTLLLQEAPDTIDQRLE